MDRNSLIVAFVLVCACASAADAPPPPARAEPFVERVFERLHRFALNQPPPASFADLFHARHSSFPQAACSAT